MHTTKGATPSSKDETSVSTDPMLSASKLEEKGTCPLDNVHVQARILDGHAAERDPDPDNMGVHSISGK